MSRSRRFRSPSPFGLTLACTLAIAALTAARVGATTIRLDAREAPRRLLHAHLSIPATPGPLTLFYPKWIPGEHGPTGPINGVAGLTITAGGKKVAWERDPVDMYAFRCTVPAGAKAVEVDLDYLLPGKGERFTSGASSSDQLAILNWNQVLLYPQGVEPGKQQFTASLQMPAGWQLGTALPVDKRRGETVEFEPVSLVTLVDSPLLMGAHLRSIPLTADEPPSVVLDVACDSEAGLAFTPELLAAYKQLVSEADALFGSRHYRRYHFLLSLSDEIAHFGLEHHESSDNRVAERSLVDPDLRTRMAGLLPHEYVHSWCGKHRRPAGLVHGDYQQPQETELLWVYEGLTSYLGWVLAGRSGLRTPEISQEHLAKMAADLDNVRGRTWRPLQDTAVAAQLLFQAPDQGEAWRRSTDFYNEGVLIWLEADVTIREQTQGRRSLDDFCSRFFGGPGGAASLKTYEFDDIVAALQETAPYDWRGFLTARLNVPNAHPPLGGIENGGWKLAYSSTVPPLLQSLEEAGKSVDLRYSLGMTLGEDGTIIDVVPDSKAALAGVSPGMKVVALGGRRFARKQAREILQATHGTREPLELILENGDFYHTVELDGVDGDRYPVLQRDDSKPDRLAQILKPQGATVVAR